MLEEYGSCGDGNENAVESVVSGKLVGNEDASESIVLGELIM